MKILVSNDDGIDSPGISALVNSLSKIGVVFVVAPDRQQSAVGHSLTIASPLRVTPFKRNGQMFGYSVNGTPSDCVKIAIAELMKDKPDIVVSGINHGQNTAVNILYSGTVSAATEGMLSGIPSMAISLASHDYSSDMEPAAEIAAKIALKLLDLDMPKDTFLNVNVPFLSKELIKGIKNVRHGGSIWRDSYEMRKDPFGNPYYWFAGEYEISQDEPDSDDFVLKEGYVTVTPIRYDITNKNFLNKMNNDWN